MYKLILKSLLIVSYLFSSLFVLFADIQLKFVNKLPTDSYVARIEASKKVEIKRGSETQINENLRKFKFEITPELISDNKCKVSTFLISGKEFKKNTPEGSSNKIAYKPKLIETVILSVNNDILNKESLGKTNDKSEIIQISPLLEKFQKELHNKSAIVGEKWENTNTKKNQGRTTTFMEKYTVINTKKIGGDILVSVKNIYEEVMSAKMEKDGSKGVANRRTDATNYIKYSMNKGRIVKIIRKSNEELKYVIYRDEEIESSTIKNIEAKYFYIEKGYEKV
ncbi:MAG: hypothetical protein P9M03_11660 [Candidatus Theseobacter exili]|nr:hypothetical protein [Candidatus Theseobacter exili]